MLPSSNTSVSSNILMRCLCPSLSGVSLLCKTNPWSGHCNCSVPWLELAPSSYVCGCLVHEYYHTIVTDHHQINLMVIVPYQGTSISAFVCHWWNQWGYHGTKQCQRSTLQPSFIFGGRPINVDPLFPSVFLWWLRGDMQKTVRNSITVWHE